MKKTIKKQTKSVTLDRKTIDDLKKIRRTYSVYRSDSHFIEAAIIFYIDHLNNRI